MKMDRKSESAINPRSHRLANPSHEAASVGFSAGDNESLGDRRFAEAAYLRAGQHGFVPEDALADWFQGGAEVKALPRRGQ
jgi:hypothetical protein